MQILAVNRLLHLVAREILAIPIVHVRDVDLRLFCELGEDPKACRYLGTGKYLSSRHALQLQGEARCSLVER